MVILRETYYIYRRNLKTWLTQPMAVIAPVMSSAFIFLFFGAPLGSVTDLAGFPADDYEAFLTGMILVMTMVFSGGDVAMALLTDILSGYFEKLLLAPINPLFYPHGDAARGRHKGADPGAGHRTDRHSAGRELPGWRAGNPGGCGRRRHLWNRDGLPRPDHRLEDQERSGNDEQLASVHAPRLPPPPPSCRESSSRDGSRSRSPSTPWTTSWRGYGSSSSKGGSGRPSSPVSGRSSLRRW